MMCTSGQPPHAFPFYAYHLYAFPFPCPPPLCSQSGTIVFHVARGCHAPNMFGTVDMEKVS